MKRKSNMLMTTTSFLEGWTIESYLGTVTSHIVAGTDMFTDLFASFSDLFGGRSKSYQRELSTIHSEALRQLQEKALLMGANCIVGLRIDHDEVSGKGKQMFMVTAVGTAVKAMTTKTAKQDSSATDHLVSSDELASLVKRRRIIRSAESGKPSISGEKWEFLIQNQVQELVPAVFDLLEERYEKFSLEEDDRTFVRRSKEYFYSLPQSVAKEALYGVMRREKLQAYAIEVIGELDLLDLEKVHSLLGSDDFGIKKAILQVLAFHKQYYNEDDVRSFEELLPVIADAFPPRGERIHERGMLSSKTKEHWKCECGTKNEINAPRCLDCFRDIQGFAQNEVTPSKAMALIKERVAVLRDQFVS